MHIGQEVDEDLDDYAAYYNDRDLLRRRVDETLDLLGLEREDTPVAPPEPPAEPLTGPADDRLIAAIFAVREDEYRRALADGADGLPLAMAKALRGDLHLSAPVRAIAPVDGGLEVTVDTPVDGGRWRSPHALELLT